MSVAFSLIHLSCGISLSDFVPGGENQARGLQAQSRGVGRILRNVGKIRACFHDEADLSQMLRRRLSL